MNQLIEKPELISQGHYLLKIKTEGRAVPGQFVNIKVQDGTDPLVRRPFSVFDQSNGCIELVIRIAGRGTKILAGRAPGEIDMIGPFGKGFTLLENKKVLIVGGGVGNAPLLYLAKELCAKGCDVTYLYGSSRAETIFLEERFRKYAERFELFTDDGSAGAKGFATEGMRDIFSMEKFDMIYTCGPTPMMRSAALIAGESPIEVSMENYFGCGIGLCIGCSVETKNGLKRSCVEGPVFSGHEIDWLNLSR